LTLNTVNNLRLIHTYFSCGFVLTHTASDMSKYLIKFNLIVQYFYNNTYTKIIVVLIQSAICKICLIILIIYCIIGIENSSKKFYVHFSRNYLLHIFLGIFSVENIILKCIVNIVFIIVYNNYTY